MHVKCMRNMATFCSLDLNVIYGIAKFKKKAFV